MCGQAGSRIWSYCLMPNHVHLSAVAMRQRGNTGRPLGDESFVKRLGQLPARDLLPKNRGPKGKRQGDN